MAKDIIMKKGNDEITITEDYLEHYKKLGYKTNEKNVTKKTEEVIKQDEQKGGLNGNTSRKRGSCYCRWNSYR